MSPGLGTRNGERVLSASRWLLLATLVFAPCAYGATRAWAIAVLVILLSGVLLTWVAGCVTRRERPSIHPVLLSSVGALLVYGWWMTWNAAFDYEPMTLSFKPVSSSIAFAPGSIHQSLTLEAMLRITCLLGVSLMTCDLARHRTWRKRLIATMASTGALLVLVGLIQRLTNANSVFWGEEGFGHSFFATFRNTNNAGAFINLIWPLCAALLLKEFRMQSSSFYVHPSSLRRLWWAASLMVCLTGVIVTGSRTASLLGATFFMIGLGWFARKATDQTQNPGVRAELLMGSTLLIILIASVGAIAGLELTWNSWQSLRDELNAQNYRWLAYQVCLDMIAEAGAWGFGAGTFQTAFPYFTNSLSDAIKGRWLFAHHDYYQTLIEWGYVGSAFWAIYIFGGLIRSCHAASQARQHPRFSDGTVHVAIVLAMLQVLLHSLVDFPLQVPSIQLYVAVLLGLFWGWARCNSSGCT